ncbi:MAG: MogA/MoaB family molybdenum cofactor biosynthesis protein [Nitrososphaerales archaeon]
MKAYEEHKHKAPKKIKAMVITASTSRYEKMLKKEKFEDESGSLIASKLKGKGHEVISMKLVNDDIGMIREELLKGAYFSDADVIIINGGTGVSPRDVTIEAVEPLLEKKLEGFGEIFRRLTYEKLGSVAIMSRAKAGILNKKLVLCLPGSPDAVELGMSIIMDELTHIVYIAKGT